jgi:hypothetical protein
MPTLPRLLLAFFEICRAYSPHAERSHTSIVAPVTGLQALQTRFRKIVKALARLFCLANEPTTRDKCLRYTKPTGADQSFAVSPNEPNRVTGSAIYPILPNHSRVLVLAGQCFRAGRRGDAFHTFRSSGTKPPSVRAHRGCARHCVAPRP